MQTMNEIIEEVNEDLQLQASLLLTDSEQQALLNSGLLFLPLNGLNHTLFA